MLQYKPENSPAFWLSEYQYNPRNKASIEKLDVEVLKKIIPVRDVDEDTVIQYFYNELKKAIKVVSEDYYSDDLKDSVDLEVRSNLKKKNRLCESNHINYNVRSNRVRCDRDYCTKKLKPVETESMDLDVEYENSSTDEQSRREFYMNVQEIEIGKPIEKPVGAVLGKSSFK